jgi:hypothetical protein
MDTKEVRMFGDFGQLGIFAKLSLLVAVVPMFMGAAYAFRPTEAKLALMRPISLAAIFAGLCGLLSGLIVILRNVGVSETVSTRVAIGLAEALVPMFVASGCLTIGWLSVALGLRRLG